MSRLKKTAFGKTLYHGTSVNKLKSITQAGMLQPQEERGGWMANGEEVDFDGFTFWATEFNVAKYYATTMPYDGGPRVIIEADISTDALLPDDSDLPDTKNWEASANRNGQVKVLGPIADNYFRKLYFLNENTNEIVFECNYQGWEQEFQNHESEFGVEGESADFIKTLQDNGLEVTSNMLVNQPMSDYIEILNQFRPSRTEEIGCAIVGADIYVKIEGYPLSAQGAIFSYDIGDASGEGGVVFYDVNIEGMYNICRQNPRALDNFEYVFGNSMIYVEEDSKYHDLEMEEFVDEVKRYGKRNGLEDIATRVDMRMFKQSISNEEKNQLLESVFKKEDPISKFKELRNKRKLEENFDFDKEASVKTLPNSTKHTDFNLALADYLYKELKKMKFKVNKSNDLAIHLAFDKTIDPRYNTIILDCLDGKVYLSGNQEKDRQIGRLRNFRGTRASDAYHCMKSSIERILRKVDKYKINVYDFRNREEV